MITHAQVVLKRFSLANLYVYSTLWLLFIVFTVYLSHSWGLLSVSNISLLHLEGSEGDMSIDVQCPLYFELLDIIQLILVK